MQSGLDQLQIDLSSKVLTPSQQRVPEGEKIRKEDERERESKFDEYNRRKGKRSKEESEKSRKQKEILCLMNVANLKIKSNNDRTK